MKLTRKELNKLKQICKNYSAFKGEVSLNINYIFTSSKESASCSVTTWREATDFSDCYSGSECINKLSDMLKLVDILNVYSSPKFEIKIGRDEVGHCKYFEISNLGDTKTFNSKEELIEYLWRIYVDNSYSCEECIKIIKLISSIR